MTVEELAGVLGGRLTKLPEPNQTPVVWFDCVVRSCTAYRIYNADMILLLQPEIDPVEHHKRDMKINGWEITDGGYLCPWCSERRCVA